MREIIALIVAVVILGGMIYLIATPGGRATWNTWWHGVQKADDATNYDTLKKVEDTCRAMIASYEADRLTYEMYKDSNSEQKQEWAEQAKMRANKTAVEYNNYILKNNYVWKDNVPNDIYIKLVIIE